MPSVRKRTVGGWEIQYYDGKGNRQYSHTHEPHTREGRRKTLQEALKLEQLATQRLDERPTFIQVANRWITLTSPRWKPSHLETTKQRLEKQIYPVWGARLVDEIDPVEMSRWLTSLVEDGMSAARVRTLYMSITSPLHWALAQKIIDRDPTAGVHPPRVHREPIVPPDGDVLRSFIASIEDPRWAAVVTLAAVTGMRRGEICALQWGDIREDSIMVSRNLSGTASNVVSPKTARGTRRIAVHSKLLSVLDVWEDVQRERMTAAGYTPRPSTYVFTVDRTGTKPMPANAVTVWWCRHRPDPSIRFHDLRHFNASVMLAAGVDPVTASSRLGHSADLMFKTYAHLMPQRDTAAAGIMDAAVLG